MNEKVITRTYTFEEENACKYSWTFSRKHDLQSWIIEDLCVEQRDQSRGCSGHPKTICALLKGHSQNKFSPEDWAEAACGRNLSYGQALAQCLADLRAEHI